MEDTIQFLYHEKPNLIQFKNWNTINKNGLAHQEIPNDIVFSDEELNFWNQNGYIVLKNAISKKDCIETQNAIWNFLEMNPDNRNSWYVKHEKQSGLMVNF